MVVDAAATDTKAAERRPPAREAELSGQCGRYDVSRPTTSLRMARAGPTWGQEQFEIVNTWTNPFALA